MSKYMHPAPKFDYQTAAMKFDKLVILDLIHTHLGLDVDMEYLVTDTKFVAKDGMVKAGKFSGTVSLYFGNQFVCDLHI